MSFSIQSFYNWYRGTLRNPKYRGWLILGTILYLVSPIDLIPDFIPFVGQLDDLMIVTLLITEASQLAMDYARSRKADFTSPKGQSQESTVDVDAIPVE